MFAVSFGSVTSVCVCEPRHVCTAAICFGLLMSLMSKMRTPRNRSALAVSVDALRAAVDAAARLLDRHEEQVAVDRHVALPAGADDRGEQPRLLRRLDVVGVEAVEVAEEHVGAAERHVGVGEVQPAARRRRRAAAPAAAASGRPAPAASAGGVAVGRCRAPVARRRAGGRRSPPAAAAAAAVPARRRDAPGRRLRIEEPLRLRHRRDQLHALRRVRRRRGSPAFRPTRGSFVMDVAGLSCAIPAIARAAEKATTVNSLVATGLISGLLDRGEHAAHAVDFHLLVGDDVGGEGVDGRVLRRRRASRTAPSPW